MKPKAQMEIMGLVVIVILLIMGLLFTVTFIILRPPSETAQIATTGVIATSTLNSMLYTTTDCRDQSIQELIIDCNVYQKIQCGMSSCDYIKKTIPDLLNKTLAYQQRQYYFTITSNGNATIPGIGKPCMGQRERAYQPLSTGFGTDITITLDVCR